MYRHCDERSDVAIPMGSQVCFANQIATLRSQ
jgi:hypothetical protein